MRTFKCVICLGSTIYLNKFTLKKTSEKLLTIVYDEMFALDVCTLIVDGTNDISLLGATTQQCIAPNCAPVLSKNGDDVSFFSIVASGRLWSRAHTCTPHNVVDMS